MRIRIIHKPPLACIDGVRLDQFEVGLQYEVGNLIGAVMLAERWAEPVPSDAPALLTPLEDLASERDKSQPGNLIRASHPPRIDAPPTLALDRRRRSRNRPS